MIFSKADLQNRMIEGLEPFRLVQEVDEGDMVVYIFKYQGALYSLCVQYDIMWQPVWADVPELAEYPEVEAHEITTIEYRLK